MINSEDCILLLIDIQERLVGMLDKQEPIKRSCTNLVKVANILNIPVLITEQYPKGLGSTIEDIKCLNNAGNIVEKTSFSVLQTPKVVEILKASDRNTVILCGIETHICVYQTAMELIEAGYNVLLIKDACASRTKDCFNLGIERIKDEGAKIYNVEMLLFELIKTSTHPNFKEIQAFIK